MSTESTFFRLFRRRGFSETLEILADFPNKEAVQSTFFKRLSDVNSYPNTYFRVKDDLISHDIVAYKLNKNNDKVIYLTKKGIEIWNRIQEIEEIL